jgi:dipeptidase
VCDTLGIGFSYTKEGTSIFGKNSDREPDEAQLVISMPEREYRQSEAVDCTYIPIPQVRHTNAVLLCKPFWMWGAEMGVNEKGVVIGNEAIFVKGKKEKTLGLLGMDLLRLGLERSTTADEAALVIINLLKEYGQTGPCGYRDKKMSYMNSYLIMDRNSILVLETFGRDYALKRHSEFAAISNVITLDKGWDESSFATGTDPRSFSDLIFTQFAGGKPRRECTIRNISKRKGKIETRSAFAILRSHHGKSPAKGSNADVCMHAAGPLIRRSQTTGSLVVELDTDNGFKIFVTAGSSPCLSTFKPVIPLSPWGLPCGIEKGKAMYSTDSYWWRHEQFHMSMLFRYKDYFPSFREDMLNLEQDIYVSTPFYEWSSDSQNLYAHSKRAFDLTEELEAYYLARIKEMRKKAPMLYGQYWKKVAKKNRLPLA